MKQVVDNNLIVSLGLDKLSPAEQEHILADIGDVIYDSIIARAIKEMSDKDKIELEHLLADRPDFDRLGEFIYTHVPHIDRIAQEEIVNFKNIALNTVSGMASV
jgi:hypothetical protein